MKSKIAIRLSGYFLSALLIFTIVISTVFFLLIRNSTMDIYQTELVERATHIAEALATMPGSSMRKSSSSGYGMYIEMINDIAMTDVWIVDSDLSIITYGNSQHMVSTASELPANAEAIVSQVFLGQTEISEDFSSLFEASTLTIGVPILDSSGTVVGAVLLHSPVDGIDNALKSSVIILLISASCALMLVMILAIALSYGFTHPLRRINQVTVELTAGNYQIRSQINQKDEIGMLAKNVDILADRLKTAEDESMRMEQMRQDFVTSISHELKTPITIIRGSLEALNDGIIISDDQIKLYYQQMLNESEQLQRLVNDLLDLSKLQNNDFRLEMTNISLIDVINDIKRSASRLAQPKSITISYQESAHNPTILADYGRIRQMIMIIMDNAIKFTGINGRIDISLTQDPLLKLSVKDNGIGIDPQEIPYIFDRFFKNNQADNQHGSGLGLAIAKQIAIRHQITIQVQSKAGTGTEFIFTFPQ
ncbi:MAG: HAMP domain-containing sensor histidine kinase [Erysipelotrichaceae bacterium]|nr:HAMP domain-containing sensor histidine kinase [Erysipelotrichaceae bacterium]